MEVLEVSDMHPKVQSDGEGADLSQDAHMPSRHGIEQLHVWFQFGLLDSCHVDVFVPAESKSMSPAC